MGNPFKTSSEKLVEERVRKSPIQTRQESKRDLLPAFNASASKSSKRKQIRFLDADNLLDTPVKKETLTETEENYKTVINSLTIRKDPVFKVKGKGKGKSSKTSFSNLKEILCDSLPPVKTPERPKPLMSLKIDTPPAFAAKASRKRMIKDEEHQAQNSPKKQKLVF